jgi:hypothetical protein
MDRSTLGGCRAGTDVVNGRRCRCDTIVSRRSSMRDDDLLDDQLRQKKQYAGGYVAWLDGKVILRTETAEEIYRGIEQLSVDQRRVSIEYIEPIDVVRVY